MTTQHRNDGLSSDQQNLSSGADANDDGILVPGSPPPLGTERTDVNPGDEAGVDELPHNDGEVSLDSDDDAVLDEDVPDIDVDNAELDDAPNPR